jgi:hypothetical protein
MPFFKHPLEVGMTYCQHMCFSLSLAKKFAKASLLAFIHSFYPDIFITSSSDALDAITKQIKERITRQNEEPES